MRTPEPFAAPRSVSFRIRPRIPQIPSMRARNLFGSARARHWLLALAALAAVSLSMGPATARADGTQATIWVQVMDSCRQGLPGASLTLVAPGGSQITAGPSSGTKRVTVVHGGTCPAQRGNCQTVPVGCLSWIVTAPTSGTDTYTIQEAPTFNLADGFQENPSGATAFTGFVPCNGGSACQTESATFTLGVDGTVIGTTTNVYPDGKTATYPAGGTFAGTQIDPIVFHNFQLGTGSCDGDGDADDHLTGSPSSHCDSDAD